jgi:hypothetical protein
MRTIIKLITLFIMVTLIAGCATKAKKGDFENECERAKAHYEEMQESARLYYALGKTSLVELAVIERRIKKAKNDMIATCEEKDLPDSLRTTSTKQDSTK